MNNSLTAKEKAKIIVPFTLGAIVLTVLIITSFILDSEAYFGTAVGIFTALPLVCFIIMKIFGTTPIKRNIHFIVMHFTTICFTFTASAFSMEGFMAGAPELIGLLAAIGNAIIIAVFVAIIAVKKIVKIIKNQK